MEEPAQVKDRTVQQVSTQTRQQVSHQAHSERMAPTTLETEREVEPVGEVPMAVPVVMVVLETMGERVAVPEAITPTVAQRATDRESHQAAQEIHITQQAWQ